MATHAHTTDATAPATRYVLHSYIQCQQTLAMRLNFVLDALEHLNSENVAEDAQSTLISIATEMAAELNGNLDSTRLPEGSAL